MKIPRKVKQALRTLAGYCIKHPICDGCPLSDFCENVKQLPMCDWANWKEEKQ